MYYFVTFLKKELLQRQKVNNKYSVRAFARYLEIDSSSLSSVLKGERSYPIGKLETAFSKLKLDDLQKIEFLESISQFKEDNRKKRVDNADISSVIEGEDYLEVLAEWEYFAFLNLIKTDNMVWEVGWMSERLGVNQNRLKEVISKSLNLGLVKEVDGRYLRTMKKIVTNEDVMSQALVKAHSEELKLALNILEEDKISLVLRDFSSITLALDPKNIERAKKLIRNFRKKIGKLETGDKSEVYMLSLQLFPITKAI